MFSRNAARLFRTVTFRLTLWYMVLFSAVSLLVFSITYVALSKGLLKQVDNGLKEEAQEVAEIYLSGGIDAFRDEIRRESVSIGTQMVFFRLLTNEKVTVDASEMSEWKGIQPLKTTGDLPLGKSVIETLDVPGHSHQVRVISKRISPGNILQIGESLHDDEEIMEFYLRVSAITMSVMLVCGSIVGWLMARRAMAGVERVTQTAMSIGKSDLVSRVPPGNEGEEINKLARAFNDMLGRIQESVTELKDVTNNIAHDLRSPITSIRGIAETTLTGNQDIDDYREMAGIIVEESDRLVAMINVMLEIAMTESGVRPLKRDLIDIRGLVRSAHGFFQATAEDSGLDLKIEVPDEPLVIQGDLSQLQRLIANLLDNAIKFTPAGGKIGISASVSDGHVSITVSDTGAGITEHDLPHIFDRFYQGDQSRSTHGNGLGLSHVKAIAKAHGGEVEVRSRPGEGSTFLVMLPFDAPE